jgi:hypothetical protein
LLLLGATRGLDASRRCRTATRHQQVATDSRRGPRVYTAYTFDRRGWGVVMERPPREDYVRVTFDAYGFTFEPAVEYRDGDDFEAVAARLESDLTDWVSDWGTRGLDGMKAAHAIASGIRYHWPDRAYFVEVWQDGKRGFAQCVQPYGFPRNWPTQHEDDCACWSAVACNCPYGDL